MDYHILDIEPYLLSFERLLGFCDVLAYVDEICFGIGGGLANRQLIQIGDIPLDVASPVVALVSATGCFRTDGYGLLSTAQNVVSCPFEHFPVTVDVEVEYDTVLTRFGVFANIPIPYRTYGDVGVGIVHQSTVLDELVCVVGDGLDGD